jgi:hypothetical protein
MRTIPIKGCTRRIGATAGWDHEKDGLCHTIEVLDQEVDGHNWMQTAWLPTVRELEQLNAGYPIILSILGTRHPVVSLQIGGMEYGDPT